MKFKILISVVLASLIFGACTHKSSVDPVRGTSSIDQELKIDWARFKQDEEMPRLGKFSGQIIENDRRRALISLTREEKRQIGIPEDQLAFANFRHAGTFYVATIPGIKVNEKNEIASADDIIEKIVFSAKHWGAKVRKETKSVEVHTELGFFFKRGQGIQLWVNQDQGYKLNQIKTLKESIVYSIEAVRSKNSPDENFFPGALGPNFAIVNRVVSNTERNIQHLEDPDRQIISRRLRFDGIQSKSPVTQNPMVALLVGAITTSEKMQRSKAYEVVTNNCTSGQFDLFDSYLAYRNNNTIEHKYIRAAYNHFLEVDMKNILNFLVDMKTKDKNLDPNTSQQIDQLVAGITHDLSYKFKNVEVDSRFLLTLPALIQGHLQARGLF